MSAHDSAHDNDNASQHSKRYSIDGALELERELENEPVSPTSGSAPDRPQSLDPHVLASIITQLQQSVADLTRERDELSRSLNESRANEASVQESLTLITETYNQTKNELEAANTKLNDNEDAISLLRTKVEESRRGLMRLQSESRRASQAPSSMDLARAGLGGFGSPPPGNKRSSFVPLTGTANGRAHRRISSVSDNMSLFDASNFTSPNSMMTTFGEQTALPATSKSSKRMSGFFNRASPPQSIYPPEESAELEQLRRELSALKTELEDVKAELAEANEAKEASDMCAKALRAFIEDNKVGEKSYEQIDLSVQPIAIPKTMNHDSQHSKKPSANGSASAGWGLNKLWGTGAPPKSPPTSHSVSTSPTTALGKKFGDFFSRPGNSLSHQAPMYNGMSDTSSIPESIEPVSPAEEHAGMKIDVRTNSTTSSSLVGSPEPSKPITLAHSPALEMA
ncbi:hypothetical protein CONPUDRAFT_166958 [Coniophora puteana RWD-64-598 SS2]|uniref:Uncharacterized protein n=1 Tax=Coniophora puteana (strain RWD-64-598) TaxID=741705 RepID=A0A5M3MJQ9_CONPW|nr:uncharacterized protein CONPUDRAFT_166958 [Coniophora puteana RWD-64-598 SS2]EIW79170.1 hypothetical protein CONPUDRAFT_166958 [Coniophora puteana RWD-64-598 SS2]